MKHIFEHTSASWMSYSDYEIKKDGNETEYITPTHDAKISLYNPMKNCEQIVLDTLNLGLYLITDKKDRNKNDRLIEYAKKYGLMGLMTALPTTAEFITYENVYLPKNHFIKKEMLSTEEYLDYFFPFEKPDFRKNGIESAWTISNDKTGMALALTLNDKPQAVVMCLQKNYAEPVAWFTQMCIDLAFYCSGSFLYYHDYDLLDETQRDLYKQSMLAFDGVAPTYKIALSEKKPCIVWDFNSMIQMVQMMFSFILTDKNSSIQLCKNCGKAYIPSRKGTDFCSQKCKNQFHVNKSREKKDN